MKILTIGIDGGDQRIIQAMPMPNLHQLLDQNVCLDIEEDLWSRGWAKILCGKPGHESGAFYAKPKLDGTHDTTQAFSAHDYGKNPDIKPLWRRLSDAGHKVGFMNVPSMMPAPNVNGFAVSGGGAGAATSGKATIPEAACQPEKIQQFLSETGYMLDLRTVSSGIEDIDLFLEQLVAMTRLRTDAFIELQKRFSVQYGFIAYMAFNRIQNLAMSEIESLIENGNSPSNLFQEKLHQFYIQIDEQMSRLLSEVSPEQIMLVSDHGQSPRRYSVNVNDWLKKIGHQALPAQSVNLLKKTAKIVAGFLPKGLKHGISRSAPGLKTKLGGGIPADWEKTNAFGIRYVPGIYLNDKKRFGGPVETPEDKKSVIREIIDRFNKDTLAEEHHLFAREYRQTYSHTKYETLLPEIWIDHPDAYFFEQHGSFIAPNAEYGPIQSLDKVERDMLTGIKGRHPLLCVSPGLADLVSHDDTRDLTLAYKLTVRGMDS
jgi:predicted AlkP superfamily phosphohydrolase/phosphomutase